MEREALLIFPQKYTIDGPGEIEWDSKLGGVYFDSKDNRVIEMMKSPHVLGKLVTVHFKKETAKVSNTKSRTAKSRSVKSRSVKSRSVKSRTSNKDTVKARTANK